MKPHYQVIVIGAGTAGMACAVQSVKLGLSVLILDEQNQVGGQIYRALSRLDEPGHGYRHKLGKEYLAGSAQVKRFEQLTSEGIDYQPGATVWHAGENNQVHVLLDAATAEADAVTNVSKSEAIGYEKLVIATGAIERPVPQPGWQLPGVLGAGAAQILLKSAGMAPSDKPVLVGCGPLLYLLATQYLNCGIAVRAIVDTTTKKNKSASLRVLPRAWRGYQVLGKGVALLHSIRRSGIPVFQHATGLHYEGSAHVNAVTFTCNGKQQRLETGCVLTHFGVIPDTRLADICGCRVEWSEQQQCWHPVTDSWGASSEADVLIAGDAAGIAGAETAECRGTLTALSAAFMLGVIDTHERDRLSRTVRTKVTRQVAVREFIDTRFRIDEHFLNPPDNTMVCRCECVHAGEIREMLAIGAGGPNQLKAFTRAGMGPCQGRQCGPALEHMVAAEQKLAASQVGRLRTRSPVKPVTLGVLAQSTFPDNFDL